MTISVATRAQNRAGFGVIARRAGLCALVLALAGCVQPGAAPGTGAAPGAAPGAGATPGTGTAGTGNAMTLPGVGRVQIPQIQWPRTGARPVGGAAAAAGTPQVSDPFAGQGVRQPSIPGGGAAAGTNVVSAPGVGSATPRPPSSAQPLPAEQTKPASAPAPKNQAPNLGSTRTAASGSGKFAMPASGSIARAYKKGTNEGIDIAAAPGSPVKAAGSGTVAAVTRDTDGIPIVVVRHDNGLMTVYAGVDKLSVSKGESVSRGQAIGAARNSGILHFEVRNGFDSVDPEDYL